MMKFAHTTSSSQPKNQSTVIASYVLAVILIGMVLSQLFKFEDFVPLIASFGLGGGEPRAVVLASVLVTAEVFALPFLLRMYVSPLFRILSMVMGWGVAALWLYISTVAYSSVNAIQDAGFLGTALTVPFGWWSVMFAIILALLVGWVSWGMWPKIPLRSHHK